MQRSSLLGSVAMLAAPIGAETTPLTIPVAMAERGSAHVTIGDTVFVLPDDQAAIAATIKALPDKDSPVVLSVSGTIDTPYRVIGGMIYLFQSAGFTKVSVVTAAPAD